MSGGWGSGAPIAVSRPSGGCWPGTVFPCPNPAAIPLPALFFCGSVGRSFAAPGLDYLICAFFLLPFPRPLARPLQKFHAMSSPPFCTWTTPPPQLSPAGQCCDANECDMHRASFGASRRARWLMPDAMETGALQKFANVRRLLHTALFNGEKWPILSIVHAPNCSERWESGNQGLNRAI